MEEETIDKIFSILIREKFSEEEFWNWVKGWKDAENICEQAEDWDIKDKLDTLKEYPKLVKEIKKEMVIESL